MGAERADVVVLGLGGMGSAAAHHLARRGAKVLGIEQHGIAHALGSSHGETRVIRRAYFEHPDYVPLLTRAYELWDELEAQTETKLFERTGVLLVGPRDGVVVPAVERVAKSYGMELSSFPAAELAERYPGFSASPDETAVLEHDAGYLLVEECVRAHARIAREHGARLWTDCRVDEFGQDESGVWLSTERGRVSAARLVVCAGPWSERFLPELPLEVRRKVLLWLRAEPRAYSPADGTPVFGFEDSGRFFYGFPALEPGVVKVALHTGGTRVCAADRPQRNLEAADVDEIKALCRAHLPKVEPVVLRHAVCMYTMTPDEHFVVDRDDNVAFAAGLSGHGFKMAPVIGEALADLALDGRTELPIGFLSAARFAH